jgi:hypothetical protein
VNGTFFKKIRKKGERGEKNTQRIEKEERRNATV